MAGYLEGHVSNKILCFTGRFLGFVKCLGGDDDEVRIAMPFKGTGSDAPSRDGSIYLSLEGILIDMKIPTARVSHCRPSDGDPVSRVDLPSREAVMIEL